MKSVLKLSFTLLLITSFVAAALAGINAVTAPMIAAITEQKTQQAIAAVLPGGGEKLEQFPDESGLVKAVYGSDAGYAIEVAPSGFNGEISMMVGISTEGKVLGIDIISHSETPSLGAVAADASGAGQSFRDQFTDASDTLAVTKDGGTVDAISGATITSRAIAEGVNAALACGKALVQEVLG